MSSYHSNLAGPRKGHSAASAAKAVADACAQKLSALKKEVVRAKKAAASARKKAKKCAGKTRKAKSHAAPKKAKANRSKSRKGHSEKSVKFSDLLGKKPGKSRASKGSSLKRWTCAGPVRTGCGGSTSRVLNKVR